MILLGMRRSARLVALVLLAASLRGMPHLQRDDAACAQPVFERHDASRHTIGAAATVEHEHCAVCHWIRTPRPPFAPVAPFETPASSGVAIHRSEPAACRAPALDEVPARAPPSLML